MCQRPHRQDGRNANDEEGDGSPDGGVFAGGLELVHHVRDRNFEQRDGGGQRRHGQQDEEQEAKDVAQRHGSERGWQCHKDEARSLSSIDVERERGREDDQTCEQRIEQVAACDGQGCFAERLALVDVGTVGDHDAHAEGEREEGVSQCDESGFGGQFAEIRVEKEIHACARARERHGADDEDQQDDDEARDQDFVELFDAAGDALDHDPSGDQQGDGLPQERHVPACEIGKCLGEVSRREQVAGDRKERVVQRPAADHHVEREDRKRREYGQEAEAAPELRLAEVMERRDGVAASAAADRHLCEQDRQAYKDQAYDKEQEESRTAVLAGDVRELPHVAQSDSGTDRRQNEAGGGETLC